jgi:arylsulfatase A-like enzyme
MADIHSRLAIPLDSFDEYHVYDESSVDLTEDHQKLIRVMKKKFDSGKNFFLYLHYEKIHTGIMNSVLKIFTNYSKEYFEKKKTNEERYDRLFREAENYLQKILDEVKFQDLLNHTLVLIISDHGISVGEKFGERAYGAFCYDYTIRTFGALVSPDFSCKEITQQIRHVDFLPTILDYLHIEIDDNYQVMDGQSLLPIINGKKISEKIAYTETANPLSDNKPPKKPNTSSVRTSEWKLIFNEYNETKELYDLRNDHNEEKNLINTGLEIEEKLWNELIKLKKF